MPLKVVGGEGADDIDAQMIVAGVFESGSHEHSGYTSSAENGRNLCVKEGDPATIIGLEVEVGKFAIFFILKSAGRDFVGGAHGRGLFKITTEDEAALDEGGGGGASVRGLVGICTCLVAVTEWFEIVGISGSRNLQGVIFPATDREGSR
jgi:hypothetical protein